MKQVVKIQISNSIQCSFF